MIDEFSRYVVLGEKSFVMGESQVFDHFVHSLLQPVYRPVAWSALKKKINSFFSNTLTMNYLTAFKGCVSVMWFVEISISRKFSWCNLPLDRWKWNMQKRIIGFDVIKHDKNGYLIKKLWWLFLRILLFKTKFFCLVLTMPLTILNALVTCLKADVLIFLLKIFFMFDVYVIYSTCVFRMVLKHYLA